jgi:hypothetical protein
MGLSGRKRSEIWLWGVVIWRMGLVGTSGNAALCTCTRFSKTGYAYARKIRNNEWERGKEVVLFCYRSYSV